MSWNFTDCLTMGIKFLEAVKRRLHAIKQWSPDEIRLWHQWMPQKLTDGIPVEGNPLAPHPGVHVSNSFLGRPGISIKLHNYLRIKLSHGWYELSLLPPDYLILELNILFVLQLDSPLSEEWLAFDDLKPLLVLRTPEPMSIKVHIHLRGCTGTLSSCILPGPLGWELSRSHLLRGHNCKVSLQEKPMYHNKGQSN